MEIDLAVSALGIPVLVITRIAMHMRHKCTGQLRRSICQNLPLFHPADQVAGTVMFMVRISAGGDAFQGKSGEHQEARSQKKHKKTHHRQNRPSDAGLFCYERWEYHLFFFDLLLHLIENPPEVSRHLPPTGRLLSILHPRSLWLGMTSKVY